MPPADRARLEKVNERLRAVANEAAQLEDLDAMIVSLRNEERERSQALAAVQLRLAETITRRQEQEVKVERSLGQARDRINDEFPSLPARAGG